MKITTRESRLRVLVLCSEEPDDLLAMQVIFCLRRMGAFVHVFSDGKESAYKYSRHCQKYYTSHFPMHRNELNDFLIDLNTYIKSHKIDVVLASDIDATRILAQIASSITDAAVFPTTDLETIDLLDNKWSFYQLLRELALPTPETLIVEELIPESIAKLRSLRYPVMIKPLRLSGSRGISQLESMEDVEAYIRGEGLFTSLPLLAQTYIPGRDLGLSLLAKDGHLIAHAVMITTKSKAYGETSEYVDMPEVVAAGERLISATGYQGVAHLDLRLDDGSGEFFILECNPRFWYTVSRAMCQGLNFAELGIKLALSGIPEHVTPIQMGTFYTYPALRAQRLLSPSQPRKVSGENLRLIWMERSDAALALFRKLRRRRMRRQVAQGVGSEAIRWRVQRDQAFVTKRSP